MYEKAPDAGGFSLLSCKGFPMGLCQEQGYVCRGVIEFIPDLRISQISIIPVFFQRLNIHAQQLQHIFGGVYDLGGGLLVLADIFYVGKYLLYLLLVFQILLRIYDSYFLHVSIFLSCNSHSDWGIGLSEVAEVEQRLCIAIDAVVSAATTVQVKARRVFALAALISGDGFQKRFKFLWHKFFSLVVRLFVPAGNNYGIYYDAGAGYFVDGFDFCQLAARQACKGQQDD